MNWLNTKQVCQRLKYRRRQLTRVTFAIQHRDTPAGREWAEESLQQFEEALHTGTCPHCGYYSTWYIIPHLRWCQFAPRAEELVAEYRSNRVGLNELAEKYHLHPKQLKKRLVVGGVTAGEIEARRRELISLASGGASGKCQNPICGILIFTSPNQLPSSIFHWRNHANVKNYCPACAVEFGHVTPAELTAILNRPLH